ncbi:MAG TPA: molybdopterin converting factor subunit 1 [Cyclobacteriaceae bacterium]|jgi:molybdopterin synthase sulfur carrier subunit
MKIKVLLFGIAREIAGSSSVELELENPKVDNLIKKLQDKHEEFRQLKSVLVAVNNEYANPDQLLSSEDEIAVIPPVAGG